MLTTQTTWWQINQSCNTRATIRRHCWLDESPVMWWTHAGKNVQKWKPFSLYDQRQFLNYFGPNYKTLSLVTQLQRIKTPTPKCSIGKNVDHPNTAEDNCRQKVYATLDTIISCMKDRFMQDHYEMFSTLEQLMGNHAKKSRRKFFAFTNMIWYWNFKSPITKCSRYHKECFRRYVWHLLWCKKGCDGTE